MKNHHRFPNNRQKKYLLIGIPIAGILMVLATGYGISQLIPSDRLTSEYIQQPLSEQLKADVLDPQPAVDYSYPFPPLPGVSEAVNQRIATARLFLVPVKTTEAFQSYLGSEEGQELREDPVVSVPTGSGTADFSYTIENNRLQRVTVQISSPRLTTTEMTALVGKPQYIYKSSPSNSTLTEYVYAYHGFTLLFKGASLDRLIFYPPQTLEEYQKQYEDLDP